MKILLLFQRYARSLQILKIMVIVMFTLFSFFVTAQIPKNIQFKHFSEDHGLSQTVFQSILQDKKGYMWFGTRHGLMKYDGYSFTNFEVDPDNKNKLQDYEIRGMCEDSSGNIWLSLSSSLCKYNQHTGIFTPYNDHKKFSGPQGAVSCLLTDNRGQLWIGTDTGLCFYEPVSDKIVNLSNIVLPDTLCSRGINCLMMDHSGMIWIGTERGINIYDPVRKKIKLFSPGDKNYFPNSGITSMMQDHSGELWISIFNKGIYRYNPSAAIFKTYNHNNADQNSLSNDIVNFFLEDRHHNIWACTYGGGINIYQPATDNFNSYRADINNNHSLTSDQVLSIYEDRSGVLWIGTNGGGLNSCDLTIKKFNVYQGWDKEFMSHQPLSLYKDRSGKIYMTTFGRGIQEFDPVTGNFTSYKFGLPNDEIHSIDYCYGAIKASDENFYIVSFNSGFHRLLRKANKFIAIVPEGYFQDTRYQNQFNCIAEDLDKRLWIGTNNGLKCYDLKAKKFSGFENLFPDRNGLGSQGIVHLYCDGEGMLWIAGSNGLELFNTRTGEVKIFKHKENDPGTISNNMLTYFYDDNKGAVWIATDGGLNRFDKKSENFVAFTTKDGLADNSIVGILPDENGSLWVSTNKGICKFTPPSKENNKAICRNYNLSDGLPGDEYYYTTSVKANDGTLYFGAPGGLVAFNPAEIKDNAFIPPVVITDFSIFSKSVTPNDSTGILKFPADEAKEITLSHSQNVFSFTFSALSYIHPEKNQYAYMLENFDKDWVFTDGNRRFAHYTNLNAGEYIFKVKASNNDGVWNETPVEIKVRILPPWWQTWWFKLLCFLAVAVTFYAIYNSRMQKIRDIRRIRNKIASDLHDDLGATLSSISIMSELVNQQVKDKVPQASSILEKIGSSSRNMIESVNDMVWAINPQNDSFENIIKRMRTFASEILSAKDIAFHFDFDKNILQSKLKMEIRRNFYLIFKEAVNNLAKYSGADNAFVIIQPFDKNLKMIIRDDGNGFDVAAVVEGNGLTNMQNRAAMMKATLKLESIPGTGTTIELEFKNV